MAVVTAGCGSQSSPDLGAGRSASRPPSHATGADPDRKPVTARGWRDVGDTDGDGKPDRARVVDLHARSDNETRPEMYRLDLVSTADGTRHIRFGGDTPMPDTDASFGVHVIGGADLDGDGRREVFVQIGHGASTAFVSAFRVLDNGGLAQLTVDGSPLDLGVNGSVGHLDGFSCHPPMLTAWSAGITQSQTYLVETRRYHLMGARLEQASVSRRHAKSPPGAKGFIRCPGLPTDTG